MTKKSQSKNVIELVNFELRNYSEQEKAQFKKVREGLELYLKSIFQAMDNSPDLIRLKDVDYSQQVQLLEQIEQLKVLEEKLTTVLSQVVETKRAKLSEVKEVSDRLVKQARPLSEEDDVVAGIFADFFDYLAEPSKKAAVTKKKNSQEDEQKVDSTESGNKE